MHSAIRNIAILGSGNTAHYFGRLFTNSGFKITHVISRNPETGNALAAKTNSVYSKEIKDSLNADLVLVCVNDNSISSIYEQLAPYAKAICHCAGAVPLQPVPQNIQTGVIYPLQSLSGKDVLDLEVPVLIEAGTADFQKELEILIAACGNKYYIVNSEERKQYHLAAVFANNFSNAMLGAAEEITGNAGLDFKLLLPLIKKTFAQVEHASPADLQTGPAKRNDTVTLEAHLEMLKDNKDLQSLYKAVSNYIKGNS